MSNPTETQKKIAGVQWDQYARAAVHACLPIPDEYNNHDDSRGSNLLSIKAIAGQNLEMFVSGSDEAVELADVRYSAYRNYCVENGLTPRKPWGEYDVVPRAFVA